MAVQAEERQGLTATCYHVLYMLSILEAVARMRLNARSSKQWFRFRHDAKLHLRLVRHQLNQINRYKTNGAPIGVTAFASMIIDDLNGLTACKA